VSTFSVSSVDIRSKAALNRLDNFQSLHLDFEFE